MSEEARRVDLGVDVVGVIDAEGNQQEAKIDERMKFLWKDKYEK